MPVSPSDTDQIFRILSLPTDGTSAASLDKSGNFGTSPFYGQLSDSFINLSIVKHMGTLHTQHNKGLRIYRLVRESRLSKLPKVEPSRFIG
jgi:hypothetical protein